MKRHSLARWAAAFMMGGLLWATPARSGLDFDRDGGRWVELEYQHTSFDRGGLGLDDANWLLTGRLGLPNGVGLRLELPFVHVSADTSPQINASGVQATVGGNVYFGIELPDEREDTDWEIGVWLPTAPDDDFEDVAVLGVGASGDFVRGFERYIPNTKGALVMGHFNRSFLAGRARFLADFGLTVYDSFSRDWEASLLWGAGVEVRSPVGPRFGLGLQSRSVMESLDEQLAFVDLVADVAFSGPLLQPSVQLRRALDDERSSVVDWTLGVALRAKLP